MPHALESNSRFKIGITDPGVIAGIDYDQGTVNDGMVMITIGKPELSVAIGSVSMNQVHWLIANNDGNSTPGAFAGLCIGLGTLFGLRHFRRRA